MSGINFENNCQDSKLIWEKITFPIPSAPLTMLATAYVHETDIENFAELRSPNRRSEHVGDIWLRRGVGEGSQHVAGRR